MVFCFSSVLRRFGLTAFGVPLVLYFILIVSNNLVHVHDATTAWQLQTTQQLLEHSKNAFRLSPYYPPRTSPSSSQDNNNENAVAKMIKTKQQQERLLDTTSSTSKEKSDKTSGTSSTSLSLATTTTTTTTTSSTSAIAGQQQLQQRPSLDTLIDSNGNVIGNVEWLLDFSIIGFGKCGTSTIMNWLHQHSQLQCIQEEVWALSKGKPKGLIARLYRDLPADTVTVKYKRGYKCPADISDLRVLNYYRKYWPTAKLFVGVRHPVLWFESLFNFRVQNLNDGLPHANKLIGRCSSGMKNTCTEKGNFAYDLLRLGKTNAGSNGPRLHTELEEDILGKYRKAWYNATELAIVPNDVFLFEITQLSDVEHEPQFRNDVQRFLNLESALPPMVHATPGRKHNATVQQEKDSQKMNICHDEYKPLRADLMRIARLNAEWIVTTFVHLPGVYSSASLPGILESWKYDPCETTATTNSKSADTPQPPTTDESAPRLDPKAFVSVQSSTTTEQQRQLIDNASSSAATTTTTTTTALLSLSRPSLDTILDGEGNIIGDVQWLLDFSIIGFGKCGTSTLMEWLHQHPQLQCIQEEVWALVFGRPKGLVNRLYSELPRDTVTMKYKRGYKCPADVSDSRVLNYYRQYWPKTKVFIGVRHPILWFESLFNFRVQNLDSLPPPNKLIGRCMGGMKNTCTEKGNFAYDLMRLGRTNMNGPQPMTELEQQIVCRFRKSCYNVTEIPALRNDIFFFDMAQLGDSNETRQEAFRSNVRDFLGLDSDLPPLVQVKPGKSHNATVQAQKDLLKMDICNDEFVPLRAELMRLSRLNSQWMRETFLNLPGVYSSREHLHELLLGWMQDPCDVRKATTTTATA